MSTALQEAIKEAYVLCPVDKVVYDTIEIRQDGVQEPVFMVKGNDGMTATDENGVDHYFMPVGFQFSLPPSNEEGFQSLTIAVDNVNRIASDFIETALTQNVPVKVIYRPYLSDDLTQPQMDPPLVLFLKDVEITPTQVTGRATFMDIVNKKFPSETYNRRRFPTLG